MKDADLSAVLAQADKTKEQLIHELTEMRLKITKFEELETGLKKSREKLEHQKKHLESLIKYSSLAIVTLDEGQKIISCNRDFEKLFQFKDSEIVGKNLDELIAGQQYIKDAVSYTEETLKGKAIHGYGERKRKDGTNIYVQIFGVPVVIDGKLVGAYGIYQDITERKQAEELFRILFDRAPVGLFIIQDRKFKLINPQFLQLTGYKEDEFLGKDSLAFILPEDRNIVRKNTIKMLKGKLTLPFELRVINKTGETRWLEQTITSIHYHGRPAVLGYYVDVSERKLVERELRKSEERYRMIFEQSPLGIIHFDQKGVIVDCNKKFVEIMGSSREKLIGFNMLKSLQDKKMLLSVERALSGGTGYYEGDYLSVTGGKVTPMRAIYNRITSEDGIFLGGISLYEDITEKKKLEVQLQQSQKMEAVGTLAGGIAHDFNNILQAIFGYTQILLMGKEPSDSDYEKLEAIEKSAQRASDLTKRLLIFSRKVESKLRPVDLNNEIEQVSQMLERTIPKMINIELHLSGDINFINADPAQIEQIMMNLGVNARDAMSDGGSLIFETENVILDEEYCKTHLGSKPGQYVKLSISDTGQGMDKETLRHIFEPFYTTKETGKGTGLGLAMVYGIVKSHSGFIMCYSEPDEGTIFKIYFPIIEKEAERVESKKEKGAIKGGSETILLVDDEEVIRELGKDVLARFGYTVLMASDGETALKIYREKKEEINLVILDIIMPGMGGRKCLEELLKMNPKSRIIIASGYSINGPAKEVLKAGAKGFISKPYDMRGMLQTVRKILDKD